MSVWIVSFDSGEGCTWDYIVGSRREALEQAKTLLEQVTEDFPQFKRVKPEDFELDYGHTDSKSGYTPNAPRLLFIDKIEYYYHGA